MRLMTAAARQLAQRWIEEVAREPLDDLSALERAKLITALATAGRGVLALHRALAQFEPEALVPPQAPPEAPPPAAPAPSPPTSEDDMMDDLPAPSELAALPDDAVRDIVVEHLDSLVERRDTKSLDRSPEPCGAASLRGRELADAGAAGPAPA